MPSDPGSNPSDFETLITLPSVADVGLDIYRGCLQVGVTGLSLEVTERDTCIQGSDRVSVPQTMRADYVQRPSIPRRIARTLNSSLPRRLVDHHSYPALGDMLRRIKTWEQPDRTQKKIGQRTSFWTSPLMSSKSTKCIPDTSRSSRAMNLFVDMTMNLFPRARRSRRGRSKSPSPLTRIAMS